MWLKSPKLLGRSADKKQAVQRARRRFDKCGAALPLAELLWAKDQVKVWGAAASSDISICTYYHLSASRGASASERFLVYRKLQSSWWRRVSC